MVTTESAMSQSQNGFKAKESQNKLRKLTWVNVGRQYEIVDFKEGV